jgi:hypothetical protein
MPGVYQFRRQSGNERLRQLINGTSKSGDTALAATVSGINWVWVYNGTGEAWLRPYISFIIPHPGSHFTAPAAHAL